MNARDAERTSFKDVLSSVFFFFLRLPFIVLLILLLIVVLMSVHFLFTFVPIVTVSNLLHNAGAIAILLGPITVIYVLSLYEEKN